MAALRETNTDSAFFESRNPEGLGRNPDKSRGKVRFATIEFKKKIAKQEHNLLFSQF